MRRALTRLRQRAAATADRAARGSPVPAGQDPVEAADRSKPTARERGVMRRRLRRLARTRRMLLLELGALALEADQAQAGSREALDRTTADLVALDQQAQDLARALDEGETLDRLVASGRARRCGACGAFLWPEARYCFGCGIPAGGETETKRSDPPPPSAQTPVDGSAGDGAGDPELEESTAGLDAGDDPARAASSG